MTMFTSPRELMRALWRKAWLILLVLAVGWPLAYWFALTRPKLYEATAVLQIEAPQVVETASGEPASRGVTADSQLDLIEQKLMSRGSILSIIEAHDLFPPEMPLTTRTDLMREAISVRKIVDPAQAWRPDVIPTGLSITVRLEDPEATAAIANDLVDRILAEARSRADSRAARTLEFFEAEAGRVEAEIAELEREMARYKEENADALPEAIAASRGQLSSLTDARLELQRRIIALETGTDRMREEERARQTALLESQRDLLGQSIARIEAALARAPEVERRISGFERDLSQLESRFASLSERRTDAAMTQLIEAQDQAQRFEVLERAVVPEIAISASRSKTAVAAGAMVCALAVGLALLLEMLRPAMRTAAHVERQLGVQPVVVIPKLHAPRHLRYFGWALTLAGIVLAILAAAWAGIGRAIAVILPGWFGRVGRT